MKRPERGQSVYLRDTREHRRSRLTRLEQKPVFWVFIWLVGVAVCTSGVWFLAGAGRYPFRSLLCAVIGGLTFTGCMYYAWRARMLFYELQRAGRRLSRVDKEMDRFFVVLLRELRLPLRDIKHHVRIISAFPDGGGAEDPEDDLDRLLGSSRVVTRTQVQRRISQSAAVLDVSAESLDRLGNGLLKLARCRRNELKREWVDTNSLVVQVVNRLRPLVEEKDAVMKMQTLPACLGDADLLRQVFDCLIENALRYSSSYRQPEIRVWGWKQKGDMMYCVQDNGIGIEEEYQDKIFEIFYSQDSTREAQGIGLSVVRRIIEQHGGRLWLKSTPNKGSTFSFLIPGH
jgi:signal transduction histidine kinase